MLIKFVTDYPAVYISKIKSLVVADIQIGLEHELYEHGIVIQPQAEKFAQQLKNLIKISQAKQLIILGDLKHEVPGISLRETRHIPNFFDSVLNSAKIILCKGNHDTQLEGLIPGSVKVYDGKGFRIGKYGFFHGHAWPLKKIMQCNYLFMGHLQPGIEFQDKFGYRIIEQVWAKGKMDKEKIKKKYKIQKTGNLEVTIVPSFNPLLGCAVINKMSPEEYSGPFLKNSVINLKEAEIFLLDGTALGRLKDFK